MKVAKFQHKLRKEGTDLQNHWLHEPVYATTEWITGVTEESEL
jgi:hypothetical protein